VCDHIAVWQRGWVSVCLVCLCHFDLFYVLTLCVFSRVCVSWCVCACVFLRANSRSYARVSVELCVSMSVCLCMSHIVGKSPV